MDKKVVINELLSINKKALQCLHYVKGFDFCKPFDVASGSGKFTMNSIKKQCETNGIDLTNTTAILLTTKVNDYIYSNTKLFVVNIPEWSKFEQIDYRNVYKFNMGHFYGVTDFEQTRKNNTEKWYIVIQKTEFLILDVTEKRIDYTERMEPIGEITTWRSRDGTKHGFSSGNFQQGNKTYYINSYCSCTMKNPVDKSGYWLPNRMEELHRKASALRAKREAEKAKIHDCTAETEKIKQNIDSLKIKLSEMILNDEYRIVDRVMFNYRQLFDDYKLHCIALRDNKYSSVESIDYAIERMEKLYEKILEKINK